MYTSIIRAMWKTLNLLTTKNRRRKRGFATKPFESPSQVHNHTPSNNWFTWLTQTCILFRHQMSLTRSIDRLLSFRYGGWSGSVVQYWFIGSSLPEAISRQRKRPTVPDRCTHQSQPQSDIMLSRCRSDAAEVTCLLKKNKSLLYEGNVIADQLIRLTSLWNCFRALYLSPLNRRILQTIKQTYWTCISLLLIIINQENHWKATVMK